MGAKEINKKFRQALGISFGIFIVVIGGLRILRAEKTEAPVLRIYVWSTYFSEEILKKFTAKTGIKIQQSYLSSNEEMFAKLRAGATGFDLIQPSDYMVGQLVRLNMLKALNKLAIPNLTHLDPAYRNLPYDKEGNYSVVFTWGTTGISINTEKVKIPAEGVSWKLLLESPDPKHTSILDDMREVFAATLRFQGDSINSTDVKSLTKARQKIVAVKDRILMFNSEPKAFLLNGELNIAHIFSGDAAQTQAANPKIKYFIPKEGGTLWTDNFAIPSTAVHVKEAHEFINFIMDPEISVEIIRDKKIATTNLAAREKLTEEERNDHCVYPEPKELQKMHFLEDLGDVLQVLSRMWTELKS